jgi:hypothetical protein
MRRNKKAGSWVTTGKDFRNTPILLKPDLVGAKIIQVCDIGTNLTQFNN